MPYVFVLLLLFPVASFGQSAPLAAPTGLEASDGDYSTKVGLSWDHVRGAKVYRIFRAESPASEEAAAIGETPSILFYDTTAARSREYFYWVRAEDGDRVGPLSAPDSGIRADGLTSAFGAIIPLEPPPEPVGNPVTGAKVYLGKTLFWDEQLSSTRTVSCGTCHLPRNGGADPRAVEGSSRSAHPGVDGLFDTPDDVVGSPGVPMNEADGSYVYAEHFGLRERVTRRKALSIIDAAYSDAGLFWDGRAETKFRDPVTDELVFPDSPQLESQALEDQAFQPLLEDTEMAHIDRDWIDVVARIQESKPLALSPSVPAALQLWIGDRSYSQLFDEAFGSPEITPVRISLAIASYERTLFSDRARIDRIVSAIESFTPSEQNGHDLFFLNFCDECHRGSVLGDNRFRFIGVRPDNEDLGRAEVTGRTLDRGRFRTPSLRNVALRAPYMHNGSLATLAEVVEFYNRGGDFDSPNKDANFVRPMGLTDQEQADMVAFLETLTDPRVAAAAGPLFDRPMLYSESARIPRIVDDGSPLGVQAVEPPLIGNPNFTVAVYNAPVGVEALLVIDDVDPGLTPPEQASFFSGSVVTKDNGRERGYASISIAIPEDESLVGKTVVGRWYVPTIAAPLLSPPFELTFFGPPNPTAEVSVLSSVSAAALRVGKVAPESIVSGFGSGLASTTAAADRTPLPTTLAGVSVDVIDAAGDLRRAPLFFVSPTQINYLAPSGTVHGEATVEVHWAGAVVSRGTLQVDAVAPSLFSADSNGRGLASAQVLRVDGDGGQSIESATTPIDFGPESDQLFLILFGSGFRFRGEIPVTATIGGEAVEVLFAGPQPQFVGVDQVNLALPRSLAGGGMLDIVVQVGEIPANVVQVAFQ